MAAQAAAGPLLDRPGQKRLRKPLPQSAGDRHGLNHVADGAEADDQDAGDSAYCGIIAPRGEFPNAVRTAPTIRSFPDSFVRLRT